MNEPMLTIAGNVATDIRYAETDTGVTLARFRLASTPRRFDRGTRAWVDQETMYFGVTAWRFLADNVRDSVRKGDPVVVTGRLRQRSWAKDGRSGIDLEITADAVGHDLSRGTSRFAKVTRARVIPPEEQPGVREALELDGPVEESAGTGEVVDVPAAASGAARGETVRPATGDGPARTGASNDGSSAATEPAPEGRSRATAA